MASSLPRDIAPAFPEDVAPDQVRAKLRELLGLDELPADVDFAVELQQKHIYTTRHMIYMQMLMVI